MSDLCCWHNCHEPATTWSMDTKTGLEFGYCHAHAHKQGEVLNPDEILAAKEWFIRRFIHSMAARNFALREHGIIAMSVGDRRNMPKIRNRNAEYHFQFIITDDEKIIVRPLNEESEWAHGVIWLDEKTHKFRFTTGEVKLIVTEED